MCTLLCTCLVPTSQLKELEAQLAAATEAAAEASTKASNADQSVSRDWAAAVSDKDRVLSELLSVKARGRPRTSISDPGTGLRQSQQSYRHHDSQLCLQTYGTPQRKHSSARLLVLRVEQHGANARRLTLDCRRLQAKHEEELSALRKQLDTQEEQAASVAQELTAAKIALSTAEQVLHLAMPFKRHRASRPVPASIARPGVVQRRGPLFAIVLQHCNMSTPQSAM